MVFYYADNRGYSEATTCAKTRLCRRIAFNSYRTNPGFA